VRKPKANFKPAPPKAPVPVKVQSHIPVWLLAVLLGLVTMALYWPATRHDFVNYDDDLYVTANVHTQAGLTWENVKWAFFNPVDVNWHPLTVLSHMLDCQLYGLNPWGHHLTSVLLHTLNTMLVFLLLLRLTGATWRSVAVAALFGWHPVHVESVAWVAERKDVLSTCFGLLALIFYARYVEQSKIRNPKSRIYYGLTLGFFALGLMSKAMLVTWPCVMLLLDYWPMERFKAGNLRRLIWEKLPFFAMVAVLSVVTFIVQHQGGALAMGETLPFGARVGNALVSYCRYLGKLFWPVKLAVFYPHPGYWPLEEVLLAGGLLAGISLFLWWRRQRQPYSLMGWLWFLGTLVPVIQLVQTGDHAMADRYAYIPSLGVLIMVVWGVGELTGQWRYQAVGLSIAGLVVLGSCVVLTRQQLGYWQDSETLFRHTLAVTEKNYVAHNNLGTFFGGTGQIDRAISEYREAIRLKPNMAQTHYNLAHALARKGQFDEALVQYQEAIRLKPDYTEAHNNLGIALDNRGRFDEAISEYKEAIRLKPDYAEAYDNLGNDLDEKGQLDEAIVQYQEAIRLKPDYTDAHFNLGCVFATKGQLDEAISQFQEAIRLKPDFTLARNNLARTLETKNASPAAPPHP